MNGYDMDGKNVGLYQADAIYKLLHDPAFAGSPVAADDLLV